MNPVLQGTPPDLIKHDEKFDSIIRTILNDTIIVENNEKARELAGRYSNFTWVTPEGRIIHSNGAITGGKAKSSGLMGREREIHELENQTVQLTNRESQIREQMQEGRELIEQLDSDIEKIRSGMHQSQVEQADLKSNFETASQALQEIQNNFDLRNKRHSEIDAEIKQQKELIEQKTEENNKLDAEITTLASDLDELRETTRAQNEDLGPLTEELAHAHVVMEKVNERLVHLKAGRSGLERESVSMKNDLATRQEENKKLREDNESSNLEIEALELRRKQSVEKLNETEHNLREGQSEREQLALKIKELKHSAELMQRDEKSCENELNENRVQHAQLQSDYNHINEQSQEKFDRSLKELAESITEITKDQDELSQEVTQLRRKVDSMGSVNLAALEEYEEQNQRFQFLTSQHTDLTESKKQIEESIAKIDETCRTRFHETFEIVRDNFIEMFRRLFNGGKADLILEQLEEGDPLLDGGIEIVAQPPGKKLQTLSLMSGGEKAMTAISLLFALFQHKPAPFAILDEIDAPLDDTNVERFKSVVADFALNTQFIIISHNKQTMDLADVIYGVTMESSGISKVISVHFDQATELVSAS